MELLTSDTRASPDVSQSVWCANRITTEPVAKEGHKAPPSRRTYLVSEKFLANPCTTATMKISVSGALWAVPFTLAH